MGAGARCERDGGRALSALAEVATTTTQGAANHETRDRLIAENVGLAVWIARRYEGLTSDAGSLASAARLGLLQAAELYDPARGPFGHLAGTVCRHAVFRELKRQRRIPFMSPLYVISESGDEEERPGLPNVPPPDVELSLMVALMRTALRDLPSRERRVLELRWGLTGDEHTFREIAAELGITMATAQKTEARALLRLRRVLSRRPRPRALPPWKARKP